MMVVLTPAEELGLSGLHLDARVRQAFYAMSSETILELSAKMTEEAGRRHLLYLREGEPEVIHIMLRPIAVMPDQLAYLIEARAGKPFTLKTLAARWGWSVKEMHEQLPQEVIRIGNNDNPWLLTPQQAEALTARILGVVKVYHQDQPYSRGANRETIRQKVNSDERFLESWLKELVAQKQLQAQEETWSLPDFDIQLSDEDASGLDQLVETIQSQGFETEYIEILADQLDIPVERLTTLCTLAEGQGRLVRLNQRIMIHTQTMQRLLGAVEQHFQEHNELTVADVKDMTGTTRKYTVPLLEYLDRSGHTLRVGDKRVKPDC